MEFGEHAAIRSIVYGRLPHLFFKSELIRETLKLDGEILELARSLYQQKSLIVMGRGYNYATCLEGALVCRN